MPVVTDYKNILRDISKKDFSPVYLLHGEEPYFIDLLADAFERDAIEPSGKTFNQQVLYGRDLNAGLVVDAASRYPMMAPKQLVLIKEAYELSDIDALVPYLKKPVPSTILVLAYRGKKLRANSKAYKAIAHSGTIYESKALYDNQLPSFINARVKEAGYVMDSGVAELLAEYVGGELSALDNAISKLLLNVDPMQPLTTEDVELHVGISKKYNAFELQDALGQKNLESALRIGYVLAQNDRESPLPLILGSLYGFFSGMLALQDVLHTGERQQKEATGIYSSYRLNKLRGAAKKWTPIQVQQALLVLAEYDLKFKGVNYQLAGSPGMLTLELVERLIMTATARR